MFVSPMSTRSSGASHIPSPSATPNVSKNCWNCWTVMFTRMQFGGWTSGFMYMSSYCWVSVPTQESAYSVNIST